MATAQAESTIPAGTWQSDSVHSSAGFAVKHVVGTFRGTFEEFSATLEDGRLEGRAKVASVNVSEENLYGHLQSPEFFDGERHPEIIFASNRIDLEGDRLTIEGELTVRGVTKPVTAHGEIAGPAPGPDERDHIGVDLETTIDRHDYGIDWQLDLPGGGKTLGDEVTLTVHVELVRES